MDLIGQMARLSAYMVEQMNCTHDGACLNYIYDSELLGFEYSSIVSNDLCNRNKKLEMQNPLEEIDLSDRRGQATNLHKSVVVSGL